MNVGYSSCEHDSHYGPVNVEKLINLLISYSENIVYLTNSRILLKNATITVIVHLLTWLHRTKCTESPSPRREEN